MGVSATSGIHSTNSSQCYASQSSPTRIESENGAGIGRVERSPRGYLLIETIFVSSPFAWIGYGTLGHVERLRLI